MGKVENHKGLAYVYGEGIHEILKLDPELEVIITQLSLKENPNLTKVGMFNINYGKINND